MIVGLTPGQIAEAFTAACHDELTSLKPGNVHVHAPGHGMTVELFEDAARAAAPFIADDTLTIGGRIEGAVGASIAASQCNTNLGIVLLGAPLAAAASQGEGPLRSRLAGVLSALTVEDARAAYRAIAAANPAGLGSKPQSDVASVPEISLRAAMALARDADQIAKAYTNDFALIFEFALPALTAARLSAVTPDRAITTLHMCLLAQVPDTHITRKFGPEQAREVQVQAHRLRPQYWPRVDEGFGVLLDFDRELKAKGFNPGTTADFVVATLFAERLFLVAKGAG